MEKLTKYETIMSYVDELGGIDRLRELAKANKEGRCIILSDMQKVPVLKKRNSRMVCRQ